MPHHEETRILPYSPQQLFDLVADIEKYPEFLPWCKGAIIKSRTEQEVVADLIIGYKIFRERFTSHVYLKRPKSIEVSYQSGPLSHLTNSWQFKTDKKGCLVQFYLNFDFRSPLLSSVIGLFFEQALVKMVSAFEKRADDLYSV